MGIQEAYAVHRDELANALPPERRMRIMMTWRQMINQEAHDYADMLLSHPRRDETKPAEIETYMHAYMAGYMAGRGWIREAEAHRAAFTLGRALRDHLRGLGVPLEDLHSRWESLWMTPFGPW